MSDTVGRVVTVQVALTAEPPCTRWQGLFLEPDLPSRDEDDDEV
jgi:hypothetical protein